MKRNIMVFVGAVFFLLAVTAIVDEKKSTIQWGRSTKYTFTMSKDFKTIDGSRESPGDVSTIKMKKVK